GGEERRRLEPLRRHVHQPVLTAPQRRLPLLPFGIRQRAVHERGGDAPGAQRVHLILHQRDERRDHHRGALEEQRRKLVAEALASSGGQDGDGRPPREDGPHHRFLPLAERLVSKVLLQRLRQLHRVPPPYPTPSRGTSETGSGGGHAPSTALCSPPSASTRWSTTRTP